MILDQLCQHVGPRFDFRFRAEPKIWPFTTELTQVVIKRLAAALQSNV